MEFHLLLFLIAITFLAYAIKGLTGFGPALIVVPFFTALLGIQYALPAAAIFDTIAGFLLLITVSKQISWKFCFPLMISIALGSFIGANTVFMVSSELIQILIGIFIFLFGIYLLLTNSQKILIKNINNQKVLIGATIAGFLSGIIGGMIGMSGPILVIYLKYFFSKEFFRTQLITIFLVANMVRLFIYYKGGLLSFEESKFFIACLPALLIGLLVGHILQVHISEKHFNRVVSSILILVSLKLVFF
jgi:uncharacterized membrane protein YfcA